MTNDTNYTHRKQIRMLRYESTIPELFDREQKKKIYEAKTYQKYLGKINGISVKIIKNDELFYICARTEDELNKSYKQVIDYLIKNPHRNRLKGDKLEDLFIFR